MKKNKSYVIAEMACSHDGNPEYAREIIQAAVDSGADAIQFQLWHLDEALTPDHADFEFCRSIELAPETWKDLAQFCRKLRPDLEIIACVEEPRGIELAKEIGADAFKLHTSELSNPEMITGVAKTGCRIDLSVGASTPDEIQRALNLIKSYGDPEVWLMYGYQNFPTDPKDVNLAYATSLGNFFGLPVGYQDHCDAEHDSAFWLPAAAHGMGIQIMEKHITNDRSRKGCDHQAALGPGEFEQFVAMIRLLDEAAGNPYGRSFTEGEEKYRRYAKKSLVAARDIEAGTVLTAADLVPMRASDLGVPPDEIDALLGMTASINIPKYSLVTTSQISS